MKTFSMLTAVAAVLVLAPEDALAQDNLSGEWTLEARNDADSPTFRPYSSNWQARWKSMA